jgi:hypothetical protein
MFALRRQHLDVLEIAASVHVRHAYWPNSESSVPIVRPKPALLLKRPTVGAGECPSMLHIGIAFTGFGKRDQVRGDSLFDASSQSPVRRAMQTISNATRRTRSPSKSNRSPLRNGVIGMALLPGNRRELDPSLSHRRLGSSAAVGDFLV